MNKSKLKQIADIFGELEEAEPDSSTGYLMQLTCDHAFHRFGMRIDSSDVADALMEASPKEVKESQE